MILEALERQTGAYGTVNRGDTVEVTEELGKQLLALGNFKKAGKAESPATPDEISARNDSGILTEPVHTSGVAREILNDEGRKLHEPQPADVVADQQEIEKAAEKADEAGEARQTKEDKPASGKKTK